MYKVVEWQVPAIPPENYLTPVGNKRSVLVKEYKDCVGKNIVANLATKNSRTYRFIHSKSLQYRNSFFPRTVIDWNHLGDSVVNSKFLDLFKGAITRE